MKKVLILFAALALVSCAKTIDIVDEKEKPTDPSKDGTVKELTISTITNLTKAIAEGEDVPTDNFIGLLPRFFSNGGDTQEDQFSGYNQITNFGYSFDDKVWRGLRKYSPNPVDTTGMNLGTKGLMQDLQTENFPFDPFFWPGGDRVEMDYVAYSYCNLLKVLISAVDHYASPFLEGHSVTDIPLSSLLGGIKINPNNAYGILDYLAVADPFRYNANRMDVWYQYTVMNILTVALSQAFNDVAIEPIALAIIVALDKIVDDAKNDKALISLDKLDDLFRQYAPALIGMIFNDSKPNVNFSEVLKNLPQEEVEFVMDYVEAFDYLTGSGEGGENISAEKVNEVANKAFYVFMTKFSSISKYLQDDLLYSHGRSVKNNNGSVKATFEHAKSWVKVLVNNKSDNDIFVAGVAFEDVHTGGTLVIDNSKSAFEAYWDFTAPRRTWHYEQQGEEYNPFGPDDPDQPDQGATGVKFDPYTDNGTLTKSAVTKSTTSGSEFNDPFDSETKKMLAELIGLEEDEMDDLDEMIKILYGTGLIPDSYYVPSGCYGPANSIETIHIDEGPLKDSTALRFTCLNSVSGNSIDEVVGLASKLGGVMLPAQEPGRIKISYYSWENADEMRSVGPKQTVDTINMSQAIPYLNGKLSGIGLREVTLNLPRKSWEMGREYIYIINIGNDELTIEAHETPWIPEYVTPFLGPDVPGGTAPVNPGENLNGYFN